ncbi:MAG: prepilin-type N-terminal cleavage/methylation domain-containing protein [Puniceicoccales bacterium]|nr:prepilin-type N-terminal cleavage/methylation domain-containing protein [Puniceicoccales bacterium]
MGRLDIFSGFKKSPKEGITLVELLMAIALIGVLSAVLFRMPIPKKSDFEKKGPKEATESMVQVARKIVYLKGEEIRIQFIDEIKILKKDDKDSSSDNLLIPYADVNTNCKNSIDEFLRKTTKGSFTTTPLLILTDKDRKVIFDEDQLCYTMIQNPQKGEQIAKGKVFSEGYIDETSNPPKWQNRKSKGLVSNNYFTVYPSGLCDQVSFKADNCQLYRHDFALNSFSGLITELGK